MSDKETSPEPLGEGKVEPAATPPRTFLGPRARALVPMTTRRSDLLEAGRASWLTRTGRPAPTLKMLQAAGAAPSDEELAARAKRKDDDRKRHPLRARRGE